MDSNKQGFTLVEILVAVSILAVLAAIAIAALNPIVQFKKTRDSRRKSDLAQVKRALLLYHNDSGVYPPTAEVNTIWGSEFTSPGGNTVYMKTLPEDPGEGGTYDYAVASGNQDYCLRAVLEYTTDADIDESQARCGLACTAASVTFGSNDYAVCAD